MKPHENDDDLDRCLGAAASAKGPLGELRPAERARLLRLAADALDAAAEELIPLAQRETKLAEARLKGELTRTTFQLRTFADLLVEGSYLEATLDAPDPNWPTGARPDLRRMLLPLGPVLVFAASNFPFAFSVAGGDTAAALAAGCPVVLKAHPGHPQLGRRTFEVVSAALGQGGAPEGALSILFGEESARRALQDPRIRAGAFTGSLRGGRALFDIANSRKDPIPFYAEMGSLNPVFVTASAAHARGEEIADGYLASYTLGAGQFCTKPGLLFVPEAAAEGIERRLIAAAAEMAEAPLLNQHIATGYSALLRGLVNHPAIRVLYAGREGAAGPSPSLMRTTLRDLMEYREGLLVECFGPASIIVRYGEDQELLAAARIFSGELTATVHGSPEDAIARRLLAELSERAGRVLWNGWPTGVSVTQAMNHGGPYPATTSVLHTSVGGTSIRRFLRPICYQNIPQPLLPEALRDGNPLGIVRRENGVRRAGSPT